jgi:chromosomal replication initiator protein
LTLHDVVADLGLALVRKIGEQRYDLWFKNNTKLSWNDPHVIVGVPNRFFQEWLQETFAGPLSEAAREVLGRPVELRFVIEPGLFQTQREQQAQARPVAVPQEANPARPAPRRRWLRLEDYVAGPSNRLAHAAALHVVERPDASPNPTVFCGPPGVGKTHLLEGVAVELRRTLGDAAVLFTTAEEFTNHFLAAMKDQRMAAFRRQFREAHAVLVDDVHFFARKRATQEEFLHTFEAMRRLGRPVVLSCVGHPAELADLLPELRDRLLGGGVWPVETPDTATRLKLLQAKAGRLEFPIPPEALADLAARLRGNVRELEGALHALAHYARVHRQTLTVESARAATRHLAPPAESVQLADVERALCSFLNLEPRALHRKERTRAVSHPRMLAAYLARKHTSASYAEISRYFGSSNHTSALAGEKRVRQWLEKNQPLVIAGRPWPVRELVEKIERGL